MLSLGDSIISVVVPEGEDPALINLFICGILFFCFNLYFNLFLAFSVPFLVQIYSKKSNVPNKKYL